MYAPPANLKEEPQALWKTRVCAARSKRRRNLKAAHAIQFAYYNLCRGRQTLRCTPATEAGLTDHVWNLGEPLV
jgi:protein-disulfide isomerase-like protein with CxxC motif